MNDTESIETKKVVSRYEDRINRHGGDTLNNIWQSGLEVILCIVHESMLKRPGEIIPMVVNGNKERDFFLMLLRKIILPPIPAFYHAPRSIQDIIDHTVGKILDLMDVDHSLFKRWEGITS
jgi:hypothetical protein